MTGWTAETLRARIADPQARVRHPAGSPDPTEVAAYASGLPRAREVAVVLGMTPELRVLATTHFATVVSIDVSAEAIALYADWLGPEARRRETVHRADWLEVSRLVGPQGADAVLGDGVFGNLTLAAHARLLAEVRAVLRPGGRFVTRQALVPRGLRPDEVTWQRLRDRFRAGGLDESELGFGVRLLGHLGCCWDAEEGRLDNARLFAETDVQHAQGCWDAVERACIQRYRFDGDTLLLAQERWEQLVRDAGFGLAVVPTPGRDWSRYYQVQVLTPG